MGIFADIKNWLFGKPLPPVVFPAPVTSKIDTNGPISFESAEERKPRIGISGSSSDSKSVAAIMTQIRSTGAIPVFIGDHANRIQNKGSADKAVTDDLSSLDGLAIMGNDGDIDPSKYGAAKDAHTKVETNLARAAYEEAAISQALASGVPLLGICGGMQRINVLGGGTLHQHVPDIVGDNHHMQGDAHIAPFVPVQVVKITPDSKLAQIAGTIHSVYTPTHQELPPGVVMENSFHHQSVKDVRPDFTVNATSSDGIIEGIEPAPGSKYAGQYVMGIQWHPEFGASELGPKIANDFANAAKTYSYSKNPSVTANVEDDTQEISGQAVQKELLRRQQSRSLSRA